MTRNKISAEERARRCIDHMKFKELSSFEKYVFDYIIKKYGQLYPYTYKIFYQYGRIAEKRSNRDLKKWTKMVLYGDAIAYINDTYDMKVPYDYKAYCEWCNGRKTHPNKS